jgi:hypothetical protein
MYKRAGRYYSLFITSDGTVADADSKVGVEIQGPWLHDLPWHRAAYLPAPDVREQISP